MNSSNLSSSMFWVDFSAGLIGLLSILWPIIAVVQENASHIKTSAFFYGACNYVTMILSVISIIVDSKITNDIRIAVYVFAALDVPVTAFVIYKVLATIVIDCNLLYGTDSPFTDAGVPSIPG